jgi:hypothetical protein
VATVEALSPNHSSLLLKTAAPPAVFALAGLTLRIRPSGRHVAVFALMPILDVNEMGVGVAAAALIDATIVRAVLLPATMKLLGD